MKNVTKKLIKLALEDCTGWNFAYNFKESRRIILFSSTKLDRMKEALFSHGIEILEHNPQQELRTGNMKLGLISESANS